MLARGRILMAISIFLCSCDNQKEEGHIKAGPHPAEIPRDSTLKKETPGAAQTTLHYYLVTGRDSIKKMLKETDTASLNVIALLNRSDRRTLRNFDTLVVPDDTKLEMNTYFPFPLNAAFLRDVKKIIFFSYPTQAFAAYENGLLIKTGPTSMGKRATKTPLGLFYTNWKAEETISTVNDEWKLKWNFNIQNKMGVGFHQYSLPGYPASHSCLRLKENDAQFLYTWADQWKLNRSGGLVAHGTPVIVFGSYPFGSSRPWLALSANPAALSINETDLQSIVQEYLPDIMQKQNERGALSK